jgi:16S rRNA pseudouridine516 synthase
VDALRTGVKLDDEPAPIAAEGCEITGECSLRLTLLQGKYHQVKRMVAAAGNHVNALHRSAVGGLRLDPATLPEGEWRWLTAEDLAGLTSKD